MVLLAVSAFGAPSDNVDPGPQPALSPCDSKPCGANAQCEESNGTVSCTCLPDHFGNAYKGCKPECDVNSYCPSHQACINSKCQDPCIGSCGLNAVCSVVNHTPVCSCPDGLAGNPFELCAPAAIAHSGPLPALSPCEAVDNPECRIASDCPSHQACLTCKCQDPCPGTCGTNTECAVIKHTPVCTCHAGFTGNPFDGCAPAAVE